MKARKQLVLLSIAAVSIFSLLFSFAPTSSGTEKGERKGWPIHLRMLSGPNGGQWFFMGEKMAEILTAELLPTSSRIGGGLANIDNVGKKTADIAFTLGCFLGASSTGDEDTPPISLKNVSVLARVYPQVMYFLVRQDFAKKHRIDSVETLLKKKMRLRFASLRPGTASEFLLRILLNHGYKTDFQKLKAQGWDIVFNNYAETADNFAAGKLDCFAYTAGTDVPLIHTIEKHAEVAILPIDKKVLETLAQQFNTGAYLIKKGDYKSVQAPIFTLGDFTCLIVRRDLPNDLVGKITQTLWENKKKIADVIVDFNGLSPKTAIMKNFPMHPGALKFWKGLGSKR